MVEATAALALAGILAATAASQVRQALRLLERTRSGIALLEAARDQVEAESAAAGAGLSRCPPPLSCSTTTTATAANGLLLIRGQADNKGLSVELSVLVAVPHSSG